MLGKLNTRQIENIIYSETIGRLGCEADGKVFVVPLTYAFDGNHLYFHTIEGMKVSMMRKNPQVCFQIDQIDDPAHWRSIILWGKYEELDGDEAEEAIVQLLNRLHPLMASETSRPKHGLDKRQGRVSKVQVTFRIKIEEASGRFEKRVY